MTCSGAEDIQCYDAFSMVTPDSNKDDDDDTITLHLMIMLIVTAVSCFLGGAAVSYCATHYFFGNKSLNEPLMDTKYDALPLSNDDRLVNVVSHNRH